VQLRLARQGQSVRELLDQVRYDEAVRYLASSWLAVSEIGARLGFDAPGSFHRAFSRWTGLTPLTFRQRFRNEPTPARRS